MEPEKRKCENCGRAIGRAAYIPFNGGMIVCQPCCQEWEQLGEPRTIIDYHRAIADREDYQSELIARQ